MAPLHETQNSAEASTTASASLDIWHFEWVISLREPLSKRS